MIPTKVWQYSQRMLICVCCKDAKEYTWMEHLNQRHIRIPNFHGEGASRKYVRSNSYHFFGHPPSCMGEYVFDITTPLSEHTDFFSILIFWRNPTCIIAPPLASVNNYRGLNLFSCKSTPHPIPLHFWSSNKGVWKYIAYSANSLVETYALVRGKILRDNLKPPPPPFTGHIRTPISKGNNYCGN